MQETNKTFKGVLSLLGGFQSPRVNTHTLTHFTSLAVSQKAKPHWAVRLPFSYNSELGESSAEGVGRKEWPWGQLGLKQQHSRSA